MPEVEEEWGEIVDTIERHGLRRYEVSNFALPGAEAQHNLRYWRGEHYLGLGPSAVSTLELAAGSGAVRITQPTDHAAYLARRHVFDADREPLNGRDLLTERIMLGLRTAEGISSRDIVALAGSGAAVWERLRSRALGPAAEGLLVVTGETIRPTHRGMDLLDRVLRSLLDAV
jgi:oxygen-independent coproporphyrinogen-3 oxidase